MAVKMDNGLNLLRDESVDGGVGAAAIMAAPAPTSTDVEPKSSVSSDQVDTSNTLNVDGELRSNP
jgi:hypothetical protein